jgi:hypothetical protein
MNYSSIRIEGNIISTEILDKLEQGDYAGQGAKDFGFESKLKVKDDIQFAWVTAKDYWKIFQRKLERLPADASRTSETRNDWIRPLLELLGYKLESAKPELVGEKSYPISNRATNLNGFPIHIIGFQIDEKDEKNDLDKRQNTTGAKMSAHGMVQEYLNLTEHLYAFVTNGKYLRVLRDSGRIVKLSFLEFDLHRMMEDDLYADFAIMYRLLHSTRMPRTMEEGATSLIERYHQDSLDAGSRIRERLSIAVESSIVEFANGFLHHPANIALITAIEKGKFTADKFYQEMLRLIYRFLFLMVTEERHLIYSDENDTHADIYYKYYSVERLRILSEKRLYDEGRYDDHWEQLKVTFKFFEKKIFGERIGILPLDGDLFGQDALLYVSDSRLKNEVLLKCLRNLCTFENEQQQLIRVNYGSLDVEEFGSVYEGLLEYDAVLSNSNGGWTFGFKKGEGRSSSGSHYTPEELVQPLIKHSLDYVIEEKLKSAVIARSPEGTTKQSDIDALKQAKRAALLSIKVCDVACGSGHILLSAARRIATVLAQVMTDEEQPSPKSFREAIREVIRHCIYGVDKNPLAVELCKVALWLESHNPGMPLTFLDHRIRCGDSIVGLARREEIEKGISTDAFKTLPGDDKLIASLLRKRNKEERDLRIEREVKITSATTLEERKAAPGIQTLLEYQTEIVNELSTLALKSTELDMKPDNTVEDFHRKRKFYSSMQGAEYWRLKNIADLQVAQFFTPKTIEKKDSLATDTKYFDVVHNKRPSLGNFIYNATALSVEKRFFHWFLEFPEVFEQGGFDCILSNPPFLGNRSLSGTFGDDFLNWVKVEYFPAGSVDLVTYFFRRAFDVLHPGGFQSLLSTNTIAQGDAREGGLEVIQSQGGTINFAVRSMPWPGLAAVEVALVSIYKGKWKGEFVLGNKIASMISSYLDDSGFSGDPYPLKQNEGKGFMGSIVLGKGFLLEPNEALQIIEKDSKYKDVLFPYLNGEDLNSHPDQSPSRWVINFFNWPLSEMEDDSEEPKGPPYARDYPVCFNIVEKLVKPERLEKKQKDYREKWWQYARRGVDLYRTIESFEKVLVIARTSKTGAFIFVPSRQVLNANLTVIATQSFKEFSILQSSIHNVWAWQYATKLKTDLIYQPSDVYETFPYPLNLITGEEPQIENLGKQYYEVRQKQMMLMRLGLTKTYNLYHNLKLTPVIIAKESRQSPEIADQAYQDILKLRQLQKEMDEAVLAAYGWSKHSEDPAFAGSGIDLEHGFHEVEYLPENDRIRYTISEKARKEVLRRLLKLNHEIHAEEEKQGLFKEKKVAKGKKMVIPANQDSLGL